MEDSLQVFIGVFVSIFLLFIFPVYMAFEKKDDISYALAMRYTQDFVDTVKSKGYITKDMYSDFRKKLAVTGNSYDIQLIHEHTKINPVVQYYKLVDEKLILSHTTTQDEKRAYDDALIEAAIADPTVEIYRYSTDQQIQEFITEHYKTLGYEKIIETYSAEKETYETNHITSILHTEKKLWLQAINDNFVCVDSGPSDLESSPKKINFCEYVYTLNENDLFTVIIKNTNTTPASLIYNMITGNTIKNNTRIYVNYGGVVLNSRWFGKIDYSKMKHDNLELFNFDSVELDAFAEEKIFKRDGSGAEVVAFEDLMHAEKYMVEMEVRPFETTDLQKEGYVVTDDAELERYNFIVGRNGPGPQISVGLNGICILSTVGGHGKVILTYPMKITKYTKIRVRFAALPDDSTKYQATLYVDDRRVRDSIVLDYQARAWRIGEGYIRIGAGQMFHGAVKNVKIYYNND